MEYTTTDILNSAADLAQEFVEDILGLENKRVYVELDTQDKAFTTEAQNKFEVVYDKIYDKLTENSETYEVAVAISRNLEAKTVDEILKNGVTMTLPEFETAVNQGALDMFQNVFKFYKRRKEL